MSDEPKSKKKSGKSGMLLTIVGAVVLAGAGAGGGFYFASQGKASAREPAAGEEAPKPGAETLYAELEKGFTSNLREPERYVEMTLGVATQKDQTVVDAVKKHEVALRSAVLTVLGNQSIDTVSTPAGKAKLQIQLRDAINQTLKEKEGAGGIANVYFTSFIVQ